MTKNKAISYFLIITAILFVSLCTYFIISYQYPIKNTCITIKLKSGPIGAYTEQCTKQGDYKNQQFWASTGYSWCVSKDGIRIYDTERWPGRANIDCKALLNKLSFAQTIGLIVGRGLTRLVR